MSDIGKKIKELRLAQGMTLEDLGNKVGVGKSTVRKWETGMIKNMKRDKIVKLAEALGVSPAVIMQWKDEDEMLKPTIIRKYQSLPDLYRDMVDDLIETLFEKHGGEDNGNPSKK